MHHFNRLKTILVLSIFTMLAATRVIAQDSYNMFEAAWSAYVAGETNDALHLVNKALQDDPDDYFIRANLLYLQGLLLALSDEIAGIEKVQQSLELYKKHGNSSGYKTAHLSLIKLYLQAGDIETAESILEMHEKDFSSLNPGFVHHLKAQTLLHKLQSQNASMTPENRQEMLAQLLISGKKSLEEYKQLGSPGEVAYALNHHAFYLLLNNRLDEGFQEALEAQKQSLRISGAYFYNVVTMYLYQRSKYRKDAEHLVGMVKKRLKDAPDKELAFLLNFAQTWPINGGPLPN